MDENQIEKIDLNKIDWRGSREFFESLGEALDRVDDKDEKYDFTWVGKRKAIIEAGAPINKTFRPDVEASKNWDTTENLFIEGDNLDALKLLQESYLGKINMIYIDPPYNTGKDFVYHDDFKANVEEYDEATEYKDEAGNIQFKKNEKSNGRYHSDWLSMMYPRLKLARNLLADDGVIFISIDDNEHANLKKLCDEAFGEENLVANIAIELSKTQGMKVAAAQNGQIVKNHEYVLCYARNIENNINRKPLYDASEFYDGHYDIYLDEDLSTRNLFDVLKEDDVSKRSFEKYGFPINKSNLKTLFSINPDYYGYFLEKIAPNVYRESMISLTDVQSLDLTPNKVSRYKKYLIRKGNSGGIGQLQGFLDGVKQTDDYKSLMRRATIRGALWKGFYSDMMNIGKEGGIEYKNGKKPVRLMKQLAKWVNRPDGIVLDFFAGSGSTAESIMRLNSEDGGSRKWILVQLPEEAEKSSSAFKSGFVTIPELTRERIRRAGSKVASENPEAKFDYGFRALTIADTNYKEVYRSAGELEQSALLDVVDNVKEDRSDLDLLFGVLTQSALELNRPIEKREILGSDVYLYDYFGEVSGLVGCFSEQVSEETIKEIAKLKPLTAVFRDSSFADSQAKVNLSEHFRVLSPETKVKVI